MSGRKGINIQHFTKSLIPNEQSKPETNKAAMEGIGRVQSLVRRMEESKHQDCGAKETKETLVKFMVKRIESTGEGEPIKHEPGTSRAHKANINNVKAMMKESSTKADNEMMMMTKLPKVARIQGTPRIMMKKATPLEKKPTPKKQELRKKRPQLMIKMKDIRSSFSLTPIKSISRSSLRDETNRELGEMSPACLSDEKALRLYKQEMIGVTTCPVMGTKLTKTKGECKSKGDKESFGGNLNNINPGFKQVGAGSSNKRTPEITPTVDVSPEEEGTDQKPDLANRDQELETPLNCKARRDLSC